MFLMPTKSLRAWTVSLVLPCGWGLTRQTEQASLSCRGCQRDGLYLPLKLADRGSWKETSTHMAVFLPVNDQYQTMDVAAPIAQYLVMQDCLSTLPEP